jgi:putative ABC transport system permease protein
VLLTIGANMSSLLLAHGEARRRELALRRVLGASRLSLVRQLVIEGWLLALTGGLAGGALAWWSLDSLIAAYPGVLPRATDVQFDVRTAIAGIIVSLAIGTLVSVAPAIRLTRGGAEDLRHGDRGGTSPALRAQRALVMSELAIGTAVTVGALLLVQSFIRLQHVPLGFDPVQVTTATVGLPLGTDRGDDRTRQFYADLHVTLEAEPGVEAAGAISSLPVAAAPPPDLFTIEGRRVARPSEPGFIAGYVMVTPGVFEALRIGLVRGRAIQGTDVAAAPAVAVINETMAREYWPDEDPIGRRVRYPEGVENGEWSRWGPWITVVGICRDIRALGPAQPARPTIYVPHAQLPRSGYDGRSMAIVVRGDPASDPSLTLRRIVRALDPDASLSAVRPMESIAGGAVAQPRFMGWIMTVFAAIAVIVAAVGVYSVVAYGVMRRRREIGVRLALGAPRSSIIGLIGRQTSSMAIGGIAAGLVGAALLAGSMRTVLFEVDPFAWPVYSGVVLVLAVAIGLATIVPARRAMRVDPLIALKTDL